MKLPDPKVLDYMKIALGEMLDEKRVGLEKKQGQLQDALAATDPAPTGLAKEALGVYLAVVTNEIQKLDAARIQAQQWLLEMEAELAARLGTPLATTN